MPGSYPPDWPEIAERIKQAAGHRCENCGAPSAPGTILTVHHLNGDKSDCRPENLLACCQVCHLSIQGRYFPGQLWLFDPPAWARKRGLDQKSS